MAPEHVGPNFRLGIPRVWECIWEIPAQAKRKGQVT